MKGQKMIEPTHAVRRVSDGEAMLVMQRDKYRALQKSAPVGSSCWVAAKTTADETQSAIDCLATLRAPNAEATEVTA